MQPRQKASKATNSPVGPDSVDDYGQQLGFSREIVSVKKMWASAQKAWAKSLGLILALIVGVFTGSVYSKNEILSDCSFNNSFRVNSQAFTCQRKI